MHNTGQRGAAAPQDQADKDQFANAAALRIDSAGDLEEEVAEEEQRPQQGGDPLVMPRSSVMPAAEAKLKLARSRYARLYVINTIGMMYHQRFVAFVELFIGLPLSMR
jgi:hypothetical protein